MRMCFKSRFPWNASGIRRVSSHDTTWVFSHKTMASPGAGTNSHDIDLNTLLWRHNDHDGVSNHQSHGCLLSRLFRRRSKKTSKLRVTGLCVGNSPGPVNSPHKWPVTRKMFPFDDVIIYPGIFQFQHPEVFNAWSYQRYIYLNITCV